MKSPSAHTPSARALWLVLAALALAAILMVASPAQPAAAGCGGTTIVNNETELDNALAAFSAVAAGPCTFTIQLGADIPVTGMKTIANQVAGVSLVIEGNGHAVDGQGTPGVRVFFIFFDTYVTMNEITVKGGNLNNDSGAGILLYNGSQSGGHLTLTNSTVTGNTLTGDLVPTGAGIMVEPNATLTVRNSTISGNSNTGNAGGIANRGTVTLDSVTITNNSATTGGSGYGSFGGALTIRNTMIAGNTGAPDCTDIGGSVTDQGHNLVQSQNGCPFVNGVNNNIFGVAANLGPLANNGGPTQTHLPNAGSPAIDAGDTTLTVDQRGVARPFGSADDIGAVEVDDTCPNSPWDAANEGELNFAIACYNAATAPGVYTINVTQDITLAASTTVIDNATAGLELQILGAGNTVDGLGTAGVRPFEIAPNTLVKIGSLTVTGGNVTGVEAGGGILNNGNLSLSRCTIADNQAGGGGGGIRSQGGALTVDECTINANQSGADGGGISNGAGSVMSMTNSTVSGNTAAQRGGGVYHAGASGSAAIDSSTIANNTSGQDGGGVVSAVLGDMALRNTLVADNSTPDCYDALGSFTDDGHNLIESASTGCASQFPASNGNIIGVDPNLGPLVDNGGPTRTHLPHAGSPAIDAGDTTQAFDQRGVARPQGAADDIGAVEADDTCPTSPWNVGSEAELNFAIGCYNAQTAPGVYTINITQDINLTASTTAINNPNTGLELQILGDSHTVDGQGTAGVRPFTIADGTLVKMSNLTVTGGNVTGSGNYGGGIENRGDLSLYECTVSGNTVQDDGGGVSTWGALRVEYSTISGNSATGGAGNNGGGIMVHGGATETLVSNSTLSGNSAGTHGSALFTWRSVTIHSTTISDNATSAALYLSGGTTTVSNSILANTAGADDCEVGFGTLVDGGDNIVETPGGSCFLPDGPDPNLGPLANNGGPTQTHLPNAGSPAIDTGDTPLATDQRGIARPQGAADDIGAVEVETCPSDATVGNEAELNAAIACFNARTATGTSTITVTQNIPLTASTIAIDNTTAGVALVIQGGGYAVDGQDTAGVRPFEVAAATTVTMNEITVTGGNVTGEAGGGILADGNLTLNRSTVDGNTAEGPGGGVAAGPQSTVTINASTLSNNASTEPAASGGFGGGLYSVSPNLTLRNSTASGNSAALGAGGLEIFEGAATLDSVTVADNTGGTFGSGVNVGDNATAQIDNTIVDRNSGGAANVRCGLSTSATFSYSLLLDASVNCNVTNGVNGNIVGLPANLGPLADNGGPTQTHLPGASSPAIDAGATTLTADQRGISRPRGAADDMGAVEVEVPTDLDFGDAPDGYKTTLAAGGARHVATGPTLRLGPDVEPDGLPGPNADGDDLDGNDDEDGVLVFVSSRFRQVELRTNPTNCSPGPATLACWVDVDGSGAFDNNATERRTAAVPSGTNCASPLSTETFTYSLDQFTSGPVYARCRIAKDLSWTGAGGIAPDGLVASGEVEDTFYDLELIYDYGDLDFSYPVLKSANGARHLIENGAEAWLGAVAPDIEEDGIYSPNGDGDDLSGTPDDEDGVVFPTLAPGNSADLQVTVTDSDGSACLSGFVDWNNSLTLSTLAYTAIDGGGPGGLLNEVSLAAGPHTITIDVPLTAGARAAFRFRLTDECNQGGFLATGAAQNGEVEDYRPALAPVDWGDLPDGPYPTLAVNNGPRHVIAGATYLGSVGPDAETNGQPNLAANGDDINGADDEEGVLVLGPLVPGLSVDIRVRVADDDGTGYVSGFADLDGNGTLDPLVYTALNGGGPGGTASDLALSNGNHTLTIAVPATFTVGTPLRFRITDDSGQGGASATGQAANGEVEDYFVGAATYDFGDAPDSYKTTLAAGGAQHAVTAEPHFGALSPDSEADGFPGPAADGDDNDNLDDEDGVSVVVIKDARQLKIRYIPVNAALTRTFTVGCWIDVDRNGAFDNSLTGNERFTRSFTGPVNTVPPFTPYEFTLSLDLFTSGPVVVRCRDAFDEDWTRAGGIGPDGLVASGEVEDIRYDLELIYDYGDLSDSYATLKISNGPRHMVENGAQAWLGAVAPDIETDGLPSTDADFDDLYGAAPDDEDGVVFPPLVPGSSADIQVTVTDSDGSACLSGFVDWAGSGTLATLAYTAIDGGGPGGALSDVSLTAGPHTISVDVPLTAGARAAFRFRLTDECDQGGASPTGEAPNGEVEDYRPALAQLDWGDLPDGPYPTLAASNGPRHIITTASYLGSVAPDAESNGQPNLAADGDDNNGADDEDGVLVLNPLVPGLSVDIRVRVADDDGTGYVSGFADLDGNGALDPLVYTALNGGPGGIASDLALSSGDHTLTVAVPANLTFGTPLRFRITDDSGQGGASATGLAANGEVEDYLIRVASYDLGDAPDSYKTTLAAGGAQHAVTVDPYFGVRSPDSEADGFPGPAADGDDNDNFDDEDGVSVAVLQGAGLLQIRYTPINTAFAPFTVGCWIDINRDGVFDNSAGSPERWTQNFPGPVNNGSPPYTQYDFTLPLSQFTNGDLTVRCRAALDDYWTEAGGVKPDGLVRSGEVEDILVELTGLTSLTVVKHAVGGDGTFPFSSQTLTPPTFALTTTAGAAQRVFGNLIAATYDITETVPAGWALTSATCDNGNAPGAVSLAAGDAVTCTFENTRLDRSIVMTKTVGTDPGVCATTDNITVAQGTDVYYCYTVTNTGDVALPLHDLVDDQLGTLLDDFAFNLAPGATVSTVDAGAVISATVNVSVTNTAVWTAYVDPGITASYTDTATVMVMPPTAVRLAGLEAAADRPAMAWPWLLTVALLAAGVAAAGVLRLRTRRSVA